MAQTVPLPLQSRRCHDLLNSPSRVDVEDQAGLHPKRREPFPQIVVHLDLAFASGLSYGRWHNDVAALEVNRFPQKALCNSALRTPPKAISARYGRKSGAAAFSSRAISAGV